MGGEHLALSNYDTLSAAEKKEKLDILVSSGQAVNLEAIVEYEKSLGSDGDKSVITHAEKLIESGAVQPSSATPTTGHEGTDAQSGSKSSGKKE